MNATAPYPNIENSSKKRRLVLENCENKNSTVLFFVTGQEYGGARW